MSKVTGNPPQADKNLFPCLLSTVSCLLFLMACPSLSASGPEPSMVQGGGWAATYGGYNYDWANSIQQTNDGGYIVAGFFSSLVVRPILEEGWTQWVLKLKQDGEVEWQNAYRGAVAESVQQTNDGGYIVAGAKLSFSPVRKGIQHLYVQRLRPDGSVEWHKTYGGVNSEEASSIQQTRDGG